MSERIVPVEANCAICVHFGVCPVSRIGCSFFKKRVYVKGRWEAEDRQSKCSECGMKFNQDEMYYNFCPNCGADMREEPNE